MKRGLERDITCLALGNLKIGKLYHRFRIVGASLQGVLEQWRSLRLTLGAAQAYAGIGVGGPGRAVQGIFGCFLEISHALVGATLAAQIDGVVIEQIGIVRSQLEGGAKLSFDPLVIAQALI